MNRFAVASCVVLCAAMAIANAQAADGRVAFLGSVVAPTCALATLGDDDVHAHDLRAHCPQDASATRYTLHLAPATSSRVRLVEYYDGYVRARGTGASVRVATLTYD